MHKVTKVEILGRFRLDLTFADGTRGMVDLSHLAGKGVFKCWDEPRVFESVRVGPAGELAWGNQVDLCPDALYLKVTGKSLEAVFPAIQPAAARD